MASSVVQPRRVYETASVLFIDIVSYSIQTIDRQTEFLTILQEVVRATNEFQRARGEEELIVLPTGDGMALVFMRDLLSSVRCAVEIADMLQLRIEIKIRMGVHIGPVCRHADINEEINVVGGGINIAQRVMDCGDAGHILLSRNAAEVLQQLDDWHGCLHDLGIHKVKHGVEIHLFSLCKDGLGNAQFPEKLSAQRNAAKSEEVVQERALDVAIAKHVPILQPTELVALIRKLTSQGLRKVLEADPDSDLTLEDVRTKPLILDFLNEKGVSLAFRTVTVRIDSPDFWPTTQSRAIRVPATGDSAQVTFLLTPMQLGELRIKIELYTDEITVLSRVLRTSATNSDRLPLVPPQAVLTIPISVRLPKNYDLLASIVETGVFPGAEATRIFNPKLDAVLKPAGKKDGDDTGEFAIVVKPSPSQRPESRPAAQSPAFPTLDGQQGTWGRKLTVIVAGLALFALLLLLLRLLFR